MEVEQNKENKDDRKLEGNTNLNKIKTIKKNNNKVEFFLKQ